MLSVVALVLPRIGHAVRQTGSMLVSWSDRPLALATGLLVALLVLTWIRVLLSGSVKTIGRDFEV
jgi:hypothetical protein